MALLGLVAVAAVIASGVLGDSGQEPTGPVGSGLSTAVDAPDRDPTYEPMPPSSRTVIKLGDLDAPPDPTSVGSPFDPCTVIGWADLPTEVRPAGPNNPSPHGPEDGDDYTIGCRFDNSGEINMDGRQEDGHGTGSFIVTVLWGTAPPMSLSPSTFPDATAKTFGGRTGAQRPSTSPQGHRMCTGLMPVQGGVAGATVTNSRFPATDPCAVAAAALEAIANKIP